MKIEIKLRTPKEIIEELEQRELEDFEGWLACERGEACPPTASKSFKLGYERRKQLQNQENKPK